MSRELRPGNATFHCRDKEGKDHCNGLVGQAWVMEALIKASIVFDRLDCYQLAERVFLLHRFNYKIGIWHRVEIDGTELSFDSTFNHQLWFAAVASQLYKTPVAQEQALLFLRKVARNVSVYPNGVIFHGSPMGSIIDYMSLGIPIFAKEVKFRLLLKRYLKALYSKSIGYHGFNLYAFAMLKENFPSEEIWNSLLIKKILAIVESPNFQKELASSEFGYFYNVSGLEIAYALEILVNNQELSESWLNRQFEYTFLSHDFPLGRDVVDINTSIARLYQATRLKSDYKINCIK
jgi:hypothetical protein